MKKKTLLIPDVLIYKSPLAVHRLPMRGFTARNGAPMGVILPYMGLVDRRSVVCRNLVMGFWVPLQYNRRSAIRIILGYFIRVKCSGSGSKTVILVKRSTIEVRRSHNPRGILVHYLSTWS